MKGIKKRKGITLIELIIAIALMGTVLMVGYSFFSTSLKSYGSQIDNVDNQARARQVIRHISGEIRKADEIEIEDNDSIKIDGTLYRFQKDTNTLLRNENDFVTGIKFFKVSSNDGDGEIKLEITALTNDGQEFTLTSSIFIRE